jgi:hypothetical protein
MMHSGGSRSIPLRLDRWWMDHDGAAQRDGNVVGIGIGADGSATARRCPEALQGGLLCTNTPHKIKIAVITSPAHLPNRTDRL